MSFGVVIIGRNEGERLRICLESVIKSSNHIIYVDSDSTDNSVSMARSIGAEVINLDMSVPFTAARARNEGFSKLIERNPNLEYVQFVDGDCEIAPEWIMHAMQFLERHADVAAVCGRLRERYPDRSIYNLLCDWEWDSPIGETRACGGNAMFRTHAFSEANGFRLDMIAGEEPELCLRLRISGWKIWKIDAEMALHDAAMLHFSQWWKRSRRGGFSFAHGAYLHGASPEKHGIKQSRSALIWAFGIPAVCISAILGLGGYGFLLLLIYPAQVFRLAMRGKRTIHENWLRAIFLVLGKFPEFQGILNFHYRRLISNNTQLIEYK